MADALRSFLHGLADQARRFVVVPRLAVMVAMLLGLAWIGMDTYRARVVRDVPVAVLDLDGSRISRAIRLYVGASREVRVATEPPRSVEEARAMLTDGRVAAVLLIPNDLSADLKHGRKASVLLAVDGSNLLVARNVHKALAKAVGTVAAGVQLTTVNKLGEPRDSALARVVPVTVDDGLAFNPSTNYPVYVVPPLLFFLLHVFVLLATLTVLLPGATGLPPPPVPERRAAVAGRLATVAVLSVAAGAAFCWLYLPRVGIVPQAAPGIVLAFVCALVALDLLLALTFAAVMPTPIAALQAAIVLGMLSLMFSGVTWPADMFPAPLQRLASLLPFTPFARGMQVLLHHPVGWRDLADPLAGFGRQAVVLSGLLALALAGRALARAARAAFHAGRAP